MFRFAIAALVLYIFPAGSILACEVTRDFIRDASDEVLADCLRSADFVDARDASQMTLLHHMVAEQRSTELLDGLRRAIGNENWDILVSRVDTKGRTALHVAAAENSDAELTRWLLVWGADVNALHSVDDPWGFRYTLGVAPLLLAAANPQGADILSALIAAGADTAQRQPPRRRGWPAAVVASEARGTAGNLRALAAGGVDMTETGIDGNTALHIAAYNDADLADIQFLLEIGISPDVRNELGQTALIFASQQSGDRDVVRLLTRLTDEPCASDEGGMTAILALANNPVLAEDPGLRRLFHETCVEAE